MTRVQITRIAHVATTIALFQRVNFDQSRPHGRQPILAEDNRPVSLVLRVAEKEEERRSRWKMMGERQGERTRQARSISRHVNSPLKKRLKAASTYLFFPIFLFFFYPFLSLLRSFSYLLVTVFRLLPPYSFFSLSLLRAHGIIINDNSISGTRLGPG